MLAYTLAFLALSAFQTASALVIIAAFIVLAFTLGVSWGRVHEACEPTQKLADDDGNTLGRGHR